MSHQDPSETGGLQGAALRGMRQQNEADKQTLAVLRGLLESIQEHPFQNTERLVQQAIDDLSGVQSKASRQALDAIDETQHLAFRPGSPAALPAHGGTTNPHKGSITRETSGTTSLFDNRAPWVATCGWCSKTEEVGHGTITLPQSMTDKGWANSIQFGWVCPACKPIVA